MSSTKAPHTCFHCYGLYQCSPEITERSLYADYKDIITKSYFGQITWIFSLDRAGVVGHERSDLLASSAITDNNLLDPTDVKFPHSTLHSTGRELYPTNCPF